MIGRARFFVERAGVKPVRLIEPDFFGGFRVNQSRGPRLAKPQAVVRKPFKIDLRLPANGLDRPFIVGFKSFLPRIARARFGL